ncbi:putative Tetraspanin family [Leishmania utingensis]|uniref:Tetraspanin family n=1 Tax=Leishmania utingensis TaxID=653362 RepID=A0AAW3B3I0_9TRYP
MSILDSVRLLTEEGEPSALASGAAMEVEEDDIDWVNDVYRQLNGAPTLHQGARCQRLNKYRAALGLLSGILSLFGIGVLVRFSSCLFSALSLFGVTCTSSGMLAVAAGFLILATGILGCVSSCCCRRSSLSVFLAVLLFFYAVLCGMCVTYMTHIRFRNLNGLQAVWASMVAAQPGVVCDVQNKLECAGFKKTQCCRSVALDDAPLGGAVIAPTACYFEAANGTTFDINTREEVDWPHTMCAPRCSAENAKYEQTCEASLTSLLRFKFHRLVLLPSTCTVFFLMLSGIAMASALWKPRVENYVLHHF